MTPTITPPAAQTTDDLLDAIEDLHHRHDDGDPGGVFDFLEDLEQLLRINGRPQFGTPWPNRALDTIVGANDDDITVETTPAQGDNAQPPPGHTVADTAVFHGDRTGGLYITTTSHQTHHVTPGDWIICDPHGQFHPCNPDTFTAIYEPAHQTNQTTTNPDTRITELTQALADAENMIDGLENQLAETEAQLDQTG